MFTPHMLGAMWQSVASPQAPFRAFFSKQDAERLNLKFPMYNDQLRTIIQAEAERTGARNFFSAFNPDLQNPYSLNYRFGIQREITPSLMIESTYVGNRGVKFLLHRWFNQVDRVTGLRPNPDLGQGYYVDNSQTTSYNSWQTSIRKRYSFGLTGSFHYTSAKALAVRGGADTGAYYQGDNPSRVQDFFNIAPSRGPSTGDNTHVLAAEWVYELPRLKAANGVVRYALGAWDVSGIFTASTGDPLLIQQGSALESSRPDYVGGPAVLDNYRERLQYLNQAVFALVPVSSLSGATIRPGNLGSGAVRGPGQWSLDFSLGKNFPVSERVNQNSRADAFNALNHTNLTNLNTNINSSTFGVLRGTMGT